MDGAEESREMEEHVGREAFRALERKKWLVGSRFVSHKLTVTFKTKLVNYQRL